MENTKTETAFEESFPYKLIPTNLPGVFARESLPVELDVNTASRVILLRHGIFAKRPEAGDEPVLVETWKTLFGKHRKLIVPVFERKPRKPRTLQRSKQADDGSYTDNGWSGAVLEGNWFSALGFWKIPTVSKPHEPAGTDGGWDSSSWVGLGGLGSSSYLLQAGVQQSVDSNGKAIYIAWYEWISPSYSDDPNYWYQTNITNMKVKPGDTLFVSVHYSTNANGVTYGIVNFMNDSEDEAGFSIVLAAPTGLSLNDGANTCADWIMEDPDTAYPGTMLPNFTPVVFSSAFCCGPDCALGNPLNADTYTIPLSGTPLTQASVSNFGVTINYIGR